MMIKKIMQNKKQNKIKNDEETKFEQSGISR